MKAGAAAIKSSALSVPEISIKISPKAEATKNWPQDSSTPSQKRTKYAITMICTAKITAQIKTKESPAARDNSSFMHKRYSPQAAASVHSQILREGRLPMNIEMSGTKITYSEVMNEALETSV